MYEQKAPNALQFLPVIAPAVPSLCPGFPQRKEVPVLIKGAAALPLWFPRVLHWPLPAGVLAALLLSRFLPSTSAVGNAFAGLIAASLSLSAFTDGLTPASAGAAA